MASSNLFEKEIGIAAVKFKESLSFIAALEDNPTFSNPKEASPHSACRFFSSI